MPFNITIKFLNGDQLEYSVKPRLGRAKYVTHRDRIENLVHSHLGTNWNEYHIHIVFPNEEELLTRIVRRYSPQATEEDVAKGILDRSNRIVMLREYCFTGNTEIYAFAEMRQETMEVVYARFDMEEQPIMTEEDVREDGLVEAWTRQIQEALDAIE